MPRDVGPPRSTSFIWVVRFFRRLSRSSPPIGLATPPADDTDDPPPVLTELPLVAATGAAEGGVGLCVRK